MCIYIYYVLYIYIYILCVMCIYIYIYVPKALYTNVSRIPSNYESAGLSLCLLL